MIRTVLISVVITDHWIDFTKDYPEMHIPQTVFLPLQFSIYNVLPYTTLMYQHYVNFRPQNDSISVYRRRESVNSNTNEDTVRGTLPRNSESMLSAPNHL